MAGRGGPWRASMRVILRWLWARPLRGWGWGRAWGVRSQAMGVSSGGAWRGVGCSGAGRVPAPLGRLPELSRARHTKPISAFVSGGGVLIVIVNGLVRKSLQGRLYRGGGRCRWRGGNWGWRSAGAAAAGADGFCGGGGWLFVAHAGVAARRGGAGACDGPRGRGRGGAAEAEELEDPEQRHRGFTLGGCVRGPCGGVRAWGRAGGAAGGAWLGGIWCGS